jgi:hypothetical protein
MNRRCRPRPTTPVPAAGEVIPDEYLVQLYSDGHRRHNHRRGGDGERARGDDERSGRIGVEHSVVDDDFD